jgi:hypothetical protein
VVPTKGNNMFEDMVDDNYIKPTPSEQVTKRKQGSKLVVITHHDKPKSLVQVKDNLTLTIPSTLMATVAKSISSSLNVTITFSTTSSIVL